MSGHASRWRVSIDAHPVHLSWIIPAQQSEVAARDAHEARIDAVREAHRAAGVPPSRPHLHTSLMFTRAVEAPR
jgi:hypothetical protein